MAEKICSLKKRGSSGGTEIELWTNSSPTSAFAGQTLTLNSDISNYEYIKIVFACSTSENDITYSMISPISDFKKLRSSLPSGSGIRRGFSVQFRTNSQVYYREFYYIDDTSLYISSDLGTSASNRSTIPLAIYGIK